MPVLSDAAIQARIDTKGLAVDPFEPRHLTPNGLDLRIAEVVIPSTDERVVDGVATVPPGARFLVSTTEVVSLGPDLTAQLWIRSSYARKGAIAAFGKVEAGFSGTLTIGAFNASHEALEVPIGDRFCQIAFEVLTGPADALYAERSGTYQDQRGVTLAKDA